jgi:hypothetical protein
VRRPLLAIPVVLALGAGGYVMFHAGSQATPTPSKAAPSTVTTRDGRIIDLSQVRSGVATTPATPAAATDSPAIATTGSAASVVAGSPTTAATSNGSDVAASAVPQVMPAGDVTRFEETHDKGAAKPLPMPVRGSQGLQKRLGAMANCQGPEYATLTGQARSDYAKRCAKAGVTLPP